MNKLVIRNTLFVILLIVLLLVVLMIRNRSPFGKGQSAFATDPGREITRVDLSVKGEKLVLQKSGNDWTVNDKYEARKSSIVFLLDILKEIKIKSPVSPEIFEKEITAMNVKPVRVRVFEGNRQLRSFFVYSTRSNIYGNIMKRREGSKPFIVSVPGLESDIGSVFTTDELFWRPFVVFNVLPSRISSVKLENLRDPANSFRIENKSGKFRVFDPDSEISGWDTMRVRRYLSYFTLITFERWAMELDNDSESKIEKSAPLYRILLNRTDGTSVLLTLWEKASDEDGTRDSDRLWAKTEDAGRLFVVRYFDIDPLLKKKAYFFRQ